MGHHVMMSLLSLTWLCRHGGMHWVASFLWWIGGFLSQLLTFMPSGRCPLLKFLEMIQDMAPALSRKRSSKKKAPRSEWRNACASLWAQRMLPECLLGLPALWGQIAGLRKRWVRVGKRAEILRQCPRSQFFPQTGELDLSLPGALDLFSGSYGVARDMVKCGCPCVLTFEIHHSADEDSDPQEQSVHHGIAGAWSLWRCRYGARLLFFL